MAIAFRRAGMHGREPNAEAVDALLRDELREIILSGVGERDHVRFR